MGPRAGPARDSASASSFSAAEHGNRRVAGAPPPDERTRAYAIGAPGPRAAAASPEAAVSAPSSLTHRHASHTHTHLRGDTCTHDTHTHTHTHAHTHGTHTSHTSHTHTHALAATTATSAARRRRRASGPGPRPIWFRGGRRLGRRRPRVGPAPRRRRRRAGPGPGGSRRTSPGRRRFRDFAHENRPPRCPRGEKRVAWRLVASGGGDLLLPLRVPRFRREPPPLRATSVSRRLAFRRAALRVRGAHRRRRERRAAALAASRAAPTSRARRAPRRQPPRRPPILLAAPRALTLAAPRSRARAPFFSVGEHRAKRLRLGSPLLGARATPQTRRARVADERGGSSFRARAASSAFRRRFCDVFAPRRRRLGGSPREVELLLLRRQPRARRAVGAPAAPALERAARDAGRRRAAWNARPRARSPYRTRRRGRRAGANPRTRARDARPAHGQEPPHERAQIAPRYTASRHRRNRTATRRLTWNRASVSAASRACIDARERRRLAANARAARLRRTRRRSARRGRPRRVHGARARKRQTPGAPRRSSQPALGPGNETRSAPFERRRETAPPRQVARRTPRAARQRPGREARCDGARAEPSATSRHAARTSRRVASSHRFAIFVDATRRACCAAAASSHAPSAADATRAETRDARRTRVGAFARRAFLRRRGARATRRTPRRAPVSYHRAAILVMEAFSRRADAFASHHVANADARPSFDHLPDFRQHAFLALRACARVAPRRERRRRSVRRAERRAAFASRRVSRREAAAARRHAASDHATVRRARRAARVAKMRASERGATALRVARRAVAPGAERRGDQRAGAASCAPLATSTRGGARKIR